MIAFIIILLLLLILAGAGWFLHKKGKLKLDFLKDLLEKSKKKVAEVAETVVAGTDMLPRLRFTRMNRQDAIEHSWDFLTRITEAVSIEFSEQDKQSVLSAGRELKSQGVQYNHVVEMLVPAQSLARTVEPEKGKDQKKSAGRS